MFKLFKEEEDDDATKALDAKVEKVLRDIAGTSADVPEAVNSILQMVAAEIKKAEAKGQQVEPDNVLALLKDIMRYLPDITAVLNNYTGTLSAYAQHRALVKQERIANKLLRENRNLTKVTAILAGSTVVLAIATIVLVLHI